MPSRKDSPNRSETFGRLLSGAINSIATYEGKTAPIVEEELGELVNRRRQDHPALQGWPPAAGAAHHRDPGRGGDPARLPGARVAPALPPRRALSVRR